MVACSPDSGLATLKTCDFGQARLHCQATRVFSDYHHRAVKSEAGFLATQEEPDGEKITL